MSDCRICRNYKECKSENKDKVDKCFFVYPTEEELAKDTKEYAIGYEQGKKDAWEDIGKIINGMTNPIETMKIIIEQMKGE